MKKNEGHSLESVAISVAFFAIVVCALAAHGDSLSGGPASVGTSQASTQNSSSAITKSQSAADTDSNSQSGGSVRASSNSGFADSARSAATVAGKSLAGPMKTNFDKSRSKSTRRSSGIGRSSAWMTKEVNAIAKPKRRYVRKGSKHVARTRRNNKSWKVVDYNWSDKTKMTSYVKGNNLAR